MANKFLLLNSPLINYFHYKQGENIGQLLDSGKLYFYRADDHSVELDTFSDPEGSVANPNPIELSIVGSWPPIYLQDIPYFIEIYDKDGKSGGNLIESLDNYLPNGSQSSDSDEQANLIVNGQFNYPIEFYKTTDPDGRITQAQTAIAYGCEFFQDYSNDSGATNTQNTITFVDVSNDKIEGNPLYECQLLSQNVNPEETLKDFRWIFGEVNDFAGEDITISLQGRALGSGTETITVILEKNYGDGGSDQEDITIDTIELTQNRNKHILNYTMPSNEGKSIVNGNYVALKIQGQLNQYSHFGFTNVKIDPGNITNPVYFDESAGEEKGQIIGEVTKLQDTSLNTNYSPLVYHDGKILPTAQTGQIELMPKGKLRIDQVECDGSIYKVSDYKDKSIPYARLYSVIGSTFNQSGNLIVTAKDKTVVFSSGAGGRENSAYTNGNTGSAISVVQTVKGLRAEVRAELKTGTTDTVTLTWVDNFEATTKYSENSGNLIKFEPSTGEKIIMPIYSVKWISNTLSLPVGVMSNTVPFSVTDVDVGSGSTPPVVDLTFTSSNPNNYVDAISNVTLEPEGKSKVQSRWLDWPSKTHNNHAFINVDGDRSKNIKGGVSVFFSVDGNQPGAYLEGETSTVECKLASTDGLTGIVQKFINTMNNPFVWTFTLSSTPAASSYIEYSYVSTASSPDRYAWFEVDGVGTDPAVAGRTGTKIAIQSTDSLENVAKKIADALNDLDFSVPAASDLPTIPSSDIVWAINL